MSAMTVIGTELLALRTELEQTKKALAELQQALDFFINDADIFAAGEAAAWRKAKRVVASGATETSGDVTVGKNLPQAPIRTESNNIGGALPL